jgi:predicted nucleotidyltransferase
LSDTLNELNYLVGEKILTEIDDFYVYGGDLDSVPKRLKGNVLAKKVLLKAKAKAHFISKFPFVAAVGISGSLSKGYYDSDSDIDFFIITQHNRLWICRTLLMVYKKIFLFNSRKYFCPNYFISSEQLEIIEQNRFTATELKTLIPMEGKEYFESFYENNSWVKSYFNKFNTNLDSISNVKKSYLTLVFEELLYNKLGDAIDYFFRSITLRKWKAKFDYLSQEDFEIALKSTKNISKHHPSNFQKKVILSLNAKLEEVQHRYNIAIQKEHV